MKKILIVLFIVIGTNCWASSHFDTLKVAFETCITRTDFIKKLYSEFNDFRLEPFGMGLVRDLDFNYCQSVYELEMNYEGGSYIKLFRVFLITNTNDSIVLGNIQEIENFKTIIQSGNFRIVDSQIDNYLLQHEALYTSKKSRKEFIAQLTELIIYGFGCAESCTYNPPEAKQMLKYVHQKDYNKLVEWLEEISPELQAYAIYGLLILKKAIPIKQHEQNIIDYLTKKNGKIYHCSGCRFGITTTINEIIH